MGIIYMAIHYSKLIYMQTDPLDDTSRDNFSTQTQMQPMFDTMKLWIYYEPGSVVPGVSFFIFY